MCHIRKSIKRSEKVIVGSIVLVGLRDYQDQKGDIVFVYSREHEMILKKTKEIPDTVDCSRTNDMEEDNNTGFDFADI
jgi:translation initiation factor 1A